MVRAVVFDFGGTLVDESRTWNAMCAQYGWSEFDFAAALGATIERRRHHTDVLRVMGAAEPPREVAFEARDFYDDALPALSSAKRKGARVGIAGNTSAKVEQFLQENVDVDFIGSSSSWGYEKPDRRFFAAVIDACGCPAGEILHVGDRVDNDIVPAAAAGLQTYFVARGLWALIQQSWPEVAAVRASGPGLHGIFSGAW